MAVSADEFKSALGRWATGVTIVTACDGERVHGMTVSAFTEVSLEPPLVLVCADKTSNTLPFIEAGRAFAVNMLSSGQQALSNKFASKNETPSSQSSMPGRKLERFHTKISQLKI